MQSPVIAIHQKIVCLQVMRLQQGQIWKTDPNVHGHKERSLYLRIVQLERLSVDYKELPGPNTTEGRHKRATKKQFCRFLKNAELMNEI